MGGGGSLLKLLLYLLNVILASRSSMRVYGYRSTTLGSLKLMVSSVDRISNYSLGSGMDVGSMARSK